jgi:pimeloyl-ACP methyl ester carboxylesterase
MLPAVLRDPTQVVRSLYALFFQIPGLPEAILRNDDWKLVEKSMQATSRPGTFSDSDFEQYRQAWWRPGAFTAMLNWYRANFRRPPLYPQGERVRLPVLILWGAQDAALSRETARLSAELCDMGRLVTFEEASHWVQHEEAEVINAALIDFLRPWEMNVSPGSERRDAEER